MDRLLAALGHPVRLRIMERVLEGPRASQEQLRKDLALSKSVMSKNLSPLEANRLVRRDTARGELYAGQAERVTQLLLAAGELQLALDREHLEQLRKLDPNDDQ